MAEYTYTNTLNYYPTINYYIDAIHPAMYINVIHDSILKKPTPTFISLKLFMYNIYTIIMVPLLRNLEWIDETIKLFGL